MKEYVFILGRDKDLSVLEIITYFEFRGIEFEVIKRTEDALFLKLEDLNFEDLIKKLGGTIKIGEIIDDFEIRTRKNKVKVGISNFANLSNYNKFRDEIKKKFKEERIIAIWKKGKDKLLEPSKTIKEKLLKEGFDFLIFDKKMARTIAVFNPLEYEKRDNQRPNNDFLKSISIRMAKIMINLSGVKKNQTLLDPFCGVGVILQEALLMDIDVFGLDIDKKSVKDSIENCKWVKKKFSIRNNFKVVNGDAIKVHTKFRNIKYVATEPFLGPYLRGAPTKKESLNIISELSHLYKDFFISLNKIMSKGRVVIIMPKLADVKVDMGVILRGTGFKEAKSKYVKLPIEYAYKESKIFREIYILEK